MSDHQFPEDSSINSIIGEGTRFRGEFDLEGLLRIDGDFSGTIRTKGKVLVGSNGRAECEVHAGTVVIGGILRGDIYTSEKLIILSTGMVLGNITTPRLIIEEGVIFNGTCRIERPQAAAVAERPRVEGLSVREEPKPQAVQSEPVAAARESTPVPARVATAQVVPFKRP